MVGVWLFYPRVENGEKWIGKWSCKWVDSLELLWKLVGNWKLKFGIKTNALLFPANCNFWTMQKKKRRISQAHTPLHETNSKTKVNPRHQHSKPYQLNSWRLMPNFLDFIQTSTLSTPINVFDFDIISFHWLERFTLVFCINSKSNLLYVFDTCTW